MGIKVCDARWSEFSPLIEAVFKEAYMVGFHDGCRLIHKEYKEKDEKRCVTCRWDGACEEQFETDGVVGCLEWETKK